MTDPAVRARALQPDEFAVLHALRVHGAADRDLLVGLCWLCPEHIDMALSDLDTAGLVTRRGRSWAVTTEGRDAHATAAAADAAEHRALVAEVFRRFVVREEAFEQICAAWETRGGDDVTVLDEITMLERQVAALTATLAVALPRFGRYGPRFMALRNRMGAGSHGASVGGCPYREVWAELRTDLMVTLGAWAEAAP